MWISSYLSKVKKTGKLDMYGEKRFNDDIFSSREVISLKKIIRHIDVSKTPITTFPDNLFLDNLNSFIADGTAISSMENFLNLGRICAISLKNTPLSKIKCFKLGLCILFRDSIKSINGSVIDHSILKKSDEYPQIAAHLINRGWIPEYPPPTSEKFQELCSIFQLDTESNLHIELSESNEDIPEDYLSLKSHLVDKHNALYSQAFSLFQLNDNSFENKICNLFAEYDTYVPCEQTSIIQAVLDVI